MQASNQSPNSSMGVAMATQTQPTTPASVTLRSSVENLHTYHPQGGGEAGVEGGGWGGADGVGGRGQERKSGELSM